MWSLPSLVLLATLTTASAESEPLYSRRLAEKEGYKLTDPQQIVDSFLTVLDHITKKKRDPQNFNGDDLLNMLKKNRDVPHLRTLEQKLQPIHDAAKSSIHSLGVVMNLWEELVKETGVNTEDIKNAMTSHELFEQISERLETGSDPSHRGESAFGNKGHLRESSRM